MIKLWIYVAALSVCALSQSKTMVVTSVVSALDTNVTTFAAGSGIIIYSQSFPSQLPQGYTVFIGGISQTINGIQLITSPGVATTVGLFAAIPPSIQIGTTQVVVAYSGVVVYTGGNSAPYSIPINQYAPVFTAGAQTKAYHVSSGNFVTTTSPSMPGEQLFIDVGGLGTTAPPLQALTLTIAGLNVPISSVTVASNNSLGYLATITFTLPVNTPLGLDPMTVMIAGLSTETGTLPVGNPPYPTVPVVTSLNTSGSPATAGIAQNAWIEIHGINLVPATTAAAGVLWNTAPSFAQGQLPTSLNGVSVTVNGQPAYVYFYCSAATDTSCATDQINVLTPLDPAIGNVPVVVTNNSTSSMPYTAIMQTAVPSFLLFSAKGYVAATHLDFSLLGPATLYPGASTPAAPGETIVVYGVGFGLPSTTLTAGSASQGGALPSLPSCKIGGNAAVVGFAGLISPGLYQFNITVPSNAATADNSISCVYDGATTPASDLLSTAP